MPSSPPTSALADLATAWRAQAWAAHARGDSTRAAVLWARTDQLEETPIMAYATWLPDVLTAAGVKVVTYPGWATRSSLGKRNPGPAGPLSTTRPAVLWHHDASSPGDSPGALNNWMLPQLAVPGAASANVWVDRAGTWHIIAAGVTWHAGEVSDARWSNNNSLGIETDHTTGEAWPPALLESLRRGSAAILAHVGRTPEDGLNFHKHVALPRGSKVDPDGLDLTYERAHLTDLIQGDDMALTDDDIRKIANTVLDTPIQRGGGTGSTTLRTMVAWSEAIDNETRKQVLDAVKKVGSGSVDPATVAEQLKVVAK